MEEITAKLGQTIRLEDGTALVYMGQTNDGMPRITLDLSKTRRLPERVNIDVFGKSSPTIDIYCEESGTTDIDLKDVQPQDCDISRQTKKLWGLDEEQK